MAKLTRIVKFHSCLRQDDGDYVVSFILGDGQGRSLLLSPEAARELAKVLPINLQRGETRELPTLTAGNFSISAAL